MVEGTFQVCCLQITRRICSNCPSGGTGHTLFPSKQPRCQHCSASHMSRECDEKIARGNHIPRKCINGRVDHNANSCIVRILSETEKNIENTSSLLSELHPTSSQLGRYVAPKQTVPPALVKFSTSFVASLSVYFSQF